MPQLLENIWENENLLLALKYYCVIERVREKRAEIVAWPVTPISAADDKKIFKNMVINTGH